MLLRSTAVAAMVELVPFAAVIVVPPVPFTLKVICRTGHVVKLNGMLVVLAIEAKI